MNAAAPSLLAAPSVGRSAVGVRSAAPAPGWTAFDVTLVAMTLMYVWRVHDLMPALARLQLPTIASLAALALFVANPNPDWVRRLRHPIMVRIGVILVLGLLSVPGSVWPGYSFRFIFEDHVKTLLFIALLATAIRSVRDAERFVVVHVIGASLYCVMILTRFNVGADGRLPGLIFYDANDLAMLIVCTLPLAVYLARPGTGPGLKLLMIATLGLFMVTIVKTGSRGGFLGLVAVFGFMLIRFRAIPAKQRFGALTLVVLLFSVFATDQYWEKIATLANPQADYNWAGKSEGGRMEVWKRGVGYMVQRPVFGVGISAFGVAEGSISPMVAYKDYGRGWKWSAAHNSFVQIGAELGFPGLLVFLLLLWAGFRTASGLGPSRERGPPGREAALGQALTGTLVGYVVAGFFLSQAYSAYIHTIFALLVGLEAVCSRRQAAASASATEATAALRRPLGRGGLMVAARSGS